MRGRVPSRAVERDIDGHALFGPLPTRRILAANADPNGRAAVGRHGRHLCSWRETGAMRQGASTLTLSPTVWGCIAPSRQASRQAAPAAHILFEIPKGGVVAFWGTDCEKDPLNWPGELRGIRICCQLWGGWVWWTPRAATRDLLDKSWGKKNLQWPELAPPQQIPSRKRLTLGAQWHLWPLSPTMRHLMSVYVRQRNHIAAA